MSLEALFFFNTMAAFGGAFVAVCLAYAVHVIVCK